MTRKPTRILFFTPTLLVGGAERHTVDLCERLRDRGYAAKILVHHDRVSPIMMASPAGSDAIVLGLRGMSDLGGWLKIWRTLRQEKPDLVVAVNQTPLIISVLERFAGATSAKLACIFHTTELQSYEKYQERLFRWTVRFADLLVYVGANQQQLWESRDIRARRSVLIRNGVDLSRFVVRAAVGESVRLRLNVRSDEYLLGILASFRIEKNHVELIAALAHAKTRGIKAKLLCIGQGETRAQVEARAFDLAVADQLIFVGEQQDVVEFLAACDVGVLCSTVETFPLSAIEFLATGVPMISARVGGAPEIVKDGVNGRLYPSGDAIALGDAIVGMSNPAKRAAFAAEARNSVARFSVETMVKTYAETFDALVEG